MQKSADTPHTGSQGAGVTRLQIVLEIIYTASLGAMNVLKQHIHIIR